MNKITTPGNPRGIFTTEFAITILANIAVLASALTDVLPARYAAIASAISTGTYAISRGISKSSVIPTVTTTVSPLPPKLP